MRCRRRRARNEAAAGTRIPAQEAAGPKQRRREVRRDTSSLHRHAKDGAASPGSEPRIADARGSSPAYIRMLHYLRNGRPDLAATRVPALAATTDTRSQWFGDYPDASIARRASQT